MRYRSLGAALASIVIAVAMTLSSQTVQAGSTGEPLRASLLTSGLQGSIGGTIGPDGALYVPQGALGEITRIDLTTGAQTTFASGLPAGFPFVGIGGPMDVVFVGNTAYVLVSLVGDPLFGGSGKDGIYRINADGTHTLIADIGQFNRDNPPTAGFSYFLVNGVLYALQPSGSGFLVTDGHLNRVLRVSYGGDISIVRAFDNVVPTGTALAAGRLLMAETGPIVGTEEIGNVSSFPIHRSDAAETLATGIKMAVDVEFGPRQVLYAISQGTFGGGDPGSPALPNTGSLLRVNDDGSTTQLVGDLNLPTSVHFRGNTAYVVTLTGDVWKFENVDPAIHGNQLGLQ